MDSGFSTPVSMATLQTLLSNDPPISEGVAPAVGAAGMAAREDHRHPRVSSATIGTLNASSEATVAFSRLFSAMPVVACLLYENSDAQPVVFKVKSWAQDGNGNYTGCVIKGQRASILPALSGIILIGPLVSALANFNVFGGSAQGAQFCCLAILPSA